MKKILSNSIYILVILAILFFVPFMKAKGKIFKEENLVLLNQTSSIEQTPKIKIIYFWATWCTVCEANQKMNIFTYNYLRNLGFDFISYEEGSNGERYTKDFIQKNQIPYPVFLASKNFLESNEVNSFPTTFFLNNKNQIVFIDTGLITPLGVIFRILLMKAIDV